MSAATATVPNPAGEIARLGALVAAMEGLAYDLEAHVDSDGFYLVTAMQACAEAAKRHAQSADEALSLWAKAKGGAL